MLGAAARGGVRASWPSRSRIDEYAFAKSADGVLGLSTSPWLTCTDEVCHIPHEGMAIAGFFRTKLCKAKDAYPAALDLSLRGTPPTTRANRLGRERSTFVQLPMSALAARSAARTWSTLTLRAATLVAVAIAAAVPAASPVAIAAGISLVAWWT